ncbi:SDR family oxidoreductase [Deinococcus ruber]|uniref:NAD-dependent epimerase/dehydratase n=1 Tax=Deinococcus ruber TaxID=1848197 RepID=A0A918F363_9DEIO|nr:SDR family oxidoreductase [Deinococcus ruber]GGR02993.1 putative NAD-dependent epimerase/dehydratase [Deinococcus ruber]
MRVFVTGASGFIGSAVVPELLAAGHQVLGLARSEESAHALVAAGAEVQRGSLADLDSLRSGAEASDGVLHLAYIHDFSQIAAAAQADRQAIAALGGVLEGSGRPLVIASGVLGLATGRVATERDTPDQAIHPRMAAAQATLDLAAHNVRSSVVRLAPTVHGEGDHGFIAVLIGIAREKGVSGYIGDGSNCWPTVHRFDAARLFRLALEQAPAASVLHGVAEEGVPLRAVAEVIGRHLNLPVVSVPPEQAGEHFGWLGMFLGADVPTSNALTRELLNWQPEHPGLLEDLEQGHYFHGSPAQ